VRVIIVGGGIGGLSAAIGLRRTGHEVIVLERAPRIDPLGAGITLFANAMRALDRLGVREAVEAQGAPARRSAILTWQGDELTQVPPDLLEGTLAVHRADLQVALADAAGELRLGIEVTAVEQDEDVVVARDASGIEERAQLLIGADGLNSVVRRVIADASPSYAGIPPGGAFPRWRSSPGI
jgi:salicylate hydroxylase